MTYIRFPFQNVISLTVILKIMYLKPFRKLHLLGCFGTGQALRLEENKDEVLEGRFLVT